MKIEEQVLSREQMAHLVELGVDTSDASMAYYNISRDNQPDKWILGIANKEVATVMRSNGITEIEPTYTIGDLIEKLPKIIGFEFSCATYRYERNNFAAIRYQLLHTHDADLKEDLYKALCWVAENHIELIK